MARNPDKTGSSAPVIERDRPDTSGRALVIGRLWDQLSSTATAILEGDVDLANREFHELIAMVDLRSRALTEDPAREGRIRNVIIFQLHGLLSDRLHTFMNTAESRQEEQVVSWLAGAISICQELAHLSVAFERVTHESSDATADRQFCFAGNSGFIPIEQVAQLLGGSRHRGILTLETDDLQLDVYFDDSSIVFLNPHTLLRRVLTGSDKNHLKQFREIPQNKLVRAQRALAESGTPIAETLFELGVLEETEIRETGFLFGSEVFFNLLNHQAEVRFRYCRLDQLPPFVSRHKSHLSVTPLLLEANKQHDDWKSLLKVFPDPDRPIEPTEDSLVRVGGMDLAAHELRILAAIDDGKTSARKLTSIVGLPLPEIYQTLIRFARDEVVKPHCDPSEFAALLLLGLTEFEDEPPTPAKREFEDGPAGDPNEDDTWRTVGDALGFLDS